MIYHINEADPMIRRKIDKFDFSNPPIDPKQLATDLAETMRSHNALGLAANQCGLPYRAFVINADEVIACFNPIIVDSSDQQILLDEGCLSFPQLVMRIRRPETIKVRYTQMDGETVTDQFTGMTARVFQHELSHLDGVTMFDDASYIERERGRKRWKVIQRQSKTRCSL